MRDQDTLNLMYFTDNINSAKLRYRKLFFGDFGSYSQWERINSAITSQINVRSLIY
ncbi:MAG: hypothetical protein LBH98_03730 [Chitinispirillales bacterium]|nr:hypothetical protein [Chitinispirillales bacterium]